MTTRTTRRLNQGELIDLLDGVVAMTDVILENLAFLLEVAVAGEPVPAERLRDIGDGLPHARNALRDARAIVARHRRGGNE